MQRPGGELQGLTVGLGFRRFLREPQPGLDRGAVKRLDLPPPRVGPQLDRAGWPRAAEPVGQGPDSHVVSGHVHTWVPGTAAAPSPAWQFGGVSARTVLS